MNYIALVNIACSDQIQQGWFGARNLIDPDKSGVHVPLRVCSKNGLWKSSLWQSFLVQLLLAELVWPVTGKWWRFPVELVHQVGSAAEDFPVVAGRKSAHYNDCHGVHNREGNHCENTVNLLKSQGTWDRRMGRELLQYKKPPPAGPVFEPHPIAEKPRVAISESETSTVSNVSLTSTSRVQLFRAVTTNSDA